MGAVQFGKTNKTLSNLQDSLVKIDGNYSNMDINSTPTKANGNALDVTEAKEILKNLNAMNLSATNIVNLFAPSSTKNPNSTNVPNITSSGNMKKPSATKSGKSESDSDSDSKNGKKNSKKNGKKNSKKGGNKGGNKGGYDSDSDSDNKGGKFKPNKTKEEFCDYDNDHPWMNNYFNVSLFVLLLILIGYSMGYRLKKNN